MKIALIISLSLHVITLAVFAIKRYYYGHRPVATAPSEWSITWNKQKIDLYSDVPIDSGDIVFIGDSHIERFLLNDYFPCERVRNRGIGSNTTLQVAGRLPSLLERKPSKLFLQIGINDLAFGYSSDTTFNNIVNIINLIDKSVTMPIIISLFPTTGTDSDLNDTVKRLNTRLVEYCTQMNIAFINAYTDLLKGQELNKDLTSDGTHLNSKGYNILRSQIEKYLK